jgi:clan AA aspartic protease
MITGIVDQLEAVVELLVIDVAGRPHRVRTVIDTGYNGTLTLPAQLVVSLGLPFLGHRRAVLADGTKALLGEYAATVSWDGKLVQIGITEADGGALLGMEMLRGHRLTVDAIEGGEVRIEQLTQA